MPEPQMFQPKPPGQYATGIPGRNEQVEAQGATMPGDPAPTPGAPAPIPAKPSSTIKAYLQWARSQGITPTFTNVPGQTGQFDAGPGGQAHMIDERDAGGMIQPGAMPSRQRMGEKMSDPSNYTDPWDYADKNKEHILPALWERLFPGKEYRSALTTNEKKMWRQASQNQMKVLIQKGKWILGDKGPRKPDQKGKLTLKQRADYLNQFRKEYNEMLTKPPGTTAMTYAMSRLRELEGGLYGQEGAQAPAQGPVNQTEGMPDPQEFRQVIRLLKRQFGNDEQKIRQALKQRYPNLPV